MTCGVPSVGWQVVDIWPVIYGAHCIAKDKSDWCVGTFWALFRSHYRRQSTSRFSKDVLMEDSIIERDVRVLICDSRDDKRG